MTRVRSTPLPPNASQRLALLGEVKALLEKKAILSDPSAIHGRVLVDVLLNSKEDRRLAAYTKPKAFKQVYKAKKVSNGDTKHCTKIPHQRNVGLVNRFKGRISPHSHSSGGPQVVALPDSRAGICVPLPALWSFNVTPSIYTGGEGRRGVFKTQWDHNNPIFRRLANHSFLSGAGPNSHTIRGGHGIEPGFYYKQRQVLFSTDPGSDISGGRDRLIKRPSYPNSRSDQQHDSMCDHPEGLAISTGHSLAKGAGPDGQFSRSSSMVSTPHETYSAPLSVSLQSATPSSIQECTHVGHSTEGAGMVGIPTESSNRYGVSHESSPGSADNRRIQHGLGRTPRRSSGKRDLVSRRGVEPYQLVGTTSCVQLPEESRSVSCQQESTCSVRQLNSRRLYKQTGRHEVTNAVLTYKGDDSLGHKSRHSVVSRSYPGNIKLPGRQSVQRHFSESDRVVTFQTNRANSIQQDSHPVNRPVCIQQEQTAPSVLFPVSGREGFRRGRSVYFVEQNGGVCLPTDIDNTQSDTEDIGRRLHDHPDRSILATSILVPEPNPSDRRSTPDSTKRPRSASNARVQSSISQSGSVEVNCLDLISQRFQAEGLSKQTADLAARGRRESTLRIYSARVRPYFSWCREREISPTRAPIADVAEFLKSRFDLGLETSTVKGYKSAIQSIHRGAPDGSSIADSKVIHFLVEGMNIERPRKRRIMPSWDLPLVLKYLNQSPFEPIQSASLRDMSIKTAFLLAMASGRRCSELHALSIGEFTVFSKRGVHLHFRPGFLAKNERSDFVASPLFLPNIASPGKERGCPVRALKCYINRTCTIRGKIDQLFITTCKPYRPVAKATIAGWLVEAISKAGAVKGEGIPKAHSTRAMSSSWAFSHGLSLKEIVNTVSWRSESTFVTTYMQDLKPCSDQDHYAKTVLQAANHTH